MTVTLTTSRLRLRPLCPADAARIEELCGNWRVARMLESVPHPYPHGLAEIWIAKQPAAWRDGLAYTFSIELEGQLVGVVGIERRDGGDYALGYWLGEPWWGHGLMSEAVARLVAFARDDLGLDKLVSAYFAENPASGRIQEKLGFRRDGTGTLPSLARAGNVDAVFTVLHLADTQEPGTAS